MLQCLLLKTDQHEIAAADVRVGAVQTYSGLDSSFGDGIVFIEHRDHIHPQQVLHGGNQVLLENWICSAQTRKTKREVPDRLLRKVNHCAQKVIAQYALQSICEIFVKQVCTDQHAAQQVSPLD